MQETVGFYVCVAVQKVALHSYMCTSQDDLRSVKLQHYKRVPFRLDILPKLGDSQAISEALHCGNRSLCPTCWSLSVPSLPQNPVVCKGKWVGCKV